MLKGDIVDNVYVFNLIDVSNSGTKCLVTQNEDFWLCHGCLGHTHFYLINKITFYNLVNT